jgi:hypothetical protein
MRGWAFLMLQQDDQAIEWLPRELAINPDEPISQALLTAALALAGHSPEAHEALQRYYSLSDTKSTTVAQYKTQQLSISSNPKAVPGRPARSGDARGTNDRCGILGWSVLGSGMAQQEPAPDQGALLADRPDSANCNHSLVEDCAVPQCEQLEIS